MSLVVGRRSGRRLREEGVAMTPERSPSKAAGKRGREGGRGGMGLEGGRSCESLFVFFLCVFCFPLLPLLGFLVTITKRETRKEGRKERGLLFVGRLHVSFGLVLRLVSEGR